MKLHLFKMLLIVACFFLQSQLALAQCPYYSWVIELHSKRRGINCLAASQEISHVFQTVGYALQNGRTVEIGNFGIFKILTKKKLTKINSGEARPKQISFRPLAQLNKIINEPVK